MSWLKKSSEQKTISVILKVLLDSVKQSSHLKWLDVLFPRFFLTILINVAFFYTVYVVKLEFKDI